MYCRDGKPTSPVQLRRCDKWGGGFGICVFLYRVLEALCFFAFFAFFALAAGQIWLIHGRKEEVGRPYKACGMQGHLGRIE